MNIAVVDVAVAAVDVVDVVVAVAAVAAVDFFPFQFVRTPRTFFIISLLSTIFFSTCLCAKFKFFVINNTRTVFA